MTRVSVKLLYGVFAQKDIITRSAVLINNSEGDIRLQRLMSASLDFMTADFDIMEFYGHHYFERQTDRHALTHGIYEIGSFRGSSGHFHNPFAVICDKSILDKNCYIHIKGLDSGAMYRIEQTGQTLSGAALSNIEILLPHTQMQYSAFVFELEKID